VSSAGIGAPLTSLSPPLPREIQLEVTRSCNLRCRMCLVRYRDVPNRREGSMSFETFKRVVDELPDLRAITLQGLGEPLLAPDLYAMIEYATARGITIGFNTNATLLTRARAERLIRARLDWLHVSIDGATAGTYESIRDGSDFARVRRNLAGMLEARRELGADRPELTLIFVAMRRNVAELPAFVRLAAEVGVPAIHVQNLSHSFDDTVRLPGYDAIRAFTLREALWTNDADDAGGAADDAAAERAFADARAEAETMGVALRLPKTAERPRTRSAGSPGCFWPWEEAYVHHDGKVQPCCMIMGEDRAVLGDVHDGGFEAVWRSEGYREFRRRLLTDDPPEICRGCSLYRGVF
jgi:radical SAM protein with 4Fe4S-binding SPASM domain